MTTITLTTAIGGVLTGSFGAVAQGDYLEISTLSASAPDLGGLKLSLYIES